jgi:hypothetical protein
MSEIELDAAAVSARLQEMIIGSEEFKELDSSFGVFCPFEAMNAVRAEIRHSALFAFFLDPFRPHGFVAGFYVHFC